MAIKEFLTLSSIIGSERSMKGSFTVDILEEKRSTSALCRFYGEGVASYVNNTQLIKN